MKHTKQFTVEGMALRKILFSASTSVFHFHSSTFEAVSPAK